MENICFHFLCNLTEENSQEFNEISYVLNTEFIGTITKIRRSSCRIS